MNEIVEEDKRDIRNSNVVLALATRASAGTSMEILYAWSLSIPVVSIVTVPTSPWIVYHSYAAVDTLDQAVKVIRCLLTSSSI